MPTSLTQLTAFSLKLTDMTILLVTDYGKDPARWQRELRLRVPELSLRGWPDVGDATQIEAVLSDCPMSAYGGFAQFPNLGWVHYLGHGAGDMLLDATLPAAVPVTRQKRESIARSLAIYVVQAVTAHHLAVDTYRSQQQQKRWNRIDSPPPASVNIAVLGLGVIGYTIACRLRDLGYSVTGWSRSGRDIEGVSRAAGLDALDPLLGQCDFVVGALPETRETIGLINQQRMVSMKSGVYLVNIGRGSLIVETDLLAALDSGHVAGAALDVFGCEPLPAEDPLWSHPRVMLTPHVGGPAQDDLQVVLDEIADNYRRFKTGETLKNVVDRHLGY